MAIKETSKKIHLLPYYPKKGRVKDTSAVPTVNVFAHAGRLQFSRYAIDEMHMQGKWVRFFYDPVKKIIAWKVQDQIEQGEMKIWRQCRMHKNGIWPVSIKRLLDEFQTGRKGLAEKYKAIPVQKYRETGIMSKPNDTYYFVELKESV